MKCEYEEEEYNEDGYEEEEVYGDKFEGEVESDWSDTPKAKKASSLRTFFYIRTIYTMRALW